MIRSCDEHECRWCILEKQCFMCSASVQTTLCHRTARWVGNHGSTVLWSLDINSDVQTGHAAELDCKQQWQYQPCMPFHQELIITLVWLTVIQTWRSWSCYLSSIWIWTLAPSVCVKWIEDNKGECTCTSLQGWLVAVVYWEVEDGVIPKRERERERGSVGPLCMNTSPHSPSLQSHPFHQ